jgi:hypothetical protein
MDWKEQRCAHVGLEAPNQVIDMNIVGGALEEYVHAPSMIPLREMYGGKHP